MSGKSPKRNSGSETKPTGAASSKKAVRNSKTSELSVTKKGSSPAVGVKKKAKTTISKAKPGPITPLKSLRSTDKRDMMEIIGSAPKVPGVFQEPKPRDRENDYLVSITVEMAMKPEAINLTSSFNRGQHVVNVMSTA